MNTSTVLLRPVRMLTSALFATLIGSSMIRADNGGGGGDRHNRVLPFVMDATATSFTAPEFVGAHMLMDVFGVGNGRFLGQFTFEAPHDFNLADGSYVSDAFVSAANGDILHLVTVGHFINEVDSVGSWTIEGGTGRFESASGSGSVVNLNFGAAIHFEGTISGIRGRGHAGGHQD
jgi:hypothetical protein